MDIQLGDTVEVVLEDIKFTGEVWVYDRHGTFFNPGIPQVDVYRKEQRMLYKHIPVSCVSVIKSQGD